MLIDANKLNQKVKEGLNNKTQKVNIVEILSDLGLSMRDMYYESEAIFIIDNISMYVSEEKTEEISKMLEEDNSLKEEIVDEIVEFTSDYESPVEHETFINDSINIIEKYIKIYNRKETI